MAAERVRKPRTPPKAIGGRRKATGTRTGLLRLPRQTEASWQATVVQYATMRGWRAYHTWNSRHSAKGFPDLVLIRRPRVIFAELKRDGNYPTPDQQVWLDELLACGQAAFLWRPEDWPEVERILL